MSHSILEIWNSLSMSNLQRFCKGVAVTVEVKNGERAAVFIDSVNSAATKSSDACAVLVFSGSALKIEALCDGVTVHPSGYQEVDLSQCFVRLEPRSADFHVYTILRPGDVVKLGKKPLFTVYASKDDRSLYPERPARAEQAEQVQVNSSIPGLEDEEPNRVRDDGADESEMTRVPLIDVAKNRSPTPQRSLKTIVTETPAVARTVDALNVGGKDDEAVDSGLVDSVRKGGEDYQDIDEDDEARSASSQTDGVPQSRNKTEESQVLGDDVSYGSVTQQHPDDQDQLRPGGGEQHETAEDNNETEDEDEDKEDAVKNVHMIEHKPKVMELVQQNDDPTEDQPQPTEQAVNELQPVAGKRKSLFGGPGLLDEEEEKAVEQAADTLAVVENAKQELSGIPDKSKDSNGQGTSAAESEAERPEEVTEEEPSPIKAAPGKLQKPTPKRKSMLDLQDSNGMTVSPIDELNDELEPRDSSVSGSHGRKRKATTSGHDTPVSIKKQKIGPQSHQKVKVVVPKVSRTTPKAINQHTPTASPLGTPSLRSASQGEQSFSAARIVISSSTTADLPTVKKFIQKSGLTKVEKPTATNYDVLVISKGELKTTSKLLTSLLLGKTIATDTWLLESAKQGKVLDPKNYAHASIDDRPRGEIFKDITVLVTLALKQDYGNGWKDIQDLAKLAGVAAIKSLAHTGGKVDNNLVILGLEKGDCDATTYLREGRVVYTRDLFPTSILEGTLDLEVDRFKIVLPPSPAKKEKAKGGAKTKTRAR